MSAFSFGLVYGSLKLKYLQVSRNFIRSNKYEWIVLFNRNCQTICFWKFEVMDPRLPVFVTFCISEWWHNNYVFNFWSPKDWFFCSKFFIFVGMLVELSINDASLHWFRLLLSTKQQSLTVSGNETLFYIFSLPDVFFFFFSKLVFWASSM